MYGTRCPVTEEKYDSVHKNDGGFLLHISDKLGRFLQMLISKSYNIKVSTHGTKL